MAKLSGLLRANLGDKEEEFDLNKYLKKEVDKMIFHVLPDLPEEEIDRLHPGLRQSKNFDVVIRKKIYQVLARTGRMNPT